jgi:hypothetical protein
MSLDYNPINPIDDYDNSSDTPFEDFPTLKVGKLSPFRFKGTDRSPTLEDFKIDRKEFNNVIKKLLLIVPLEEADNTLLKYYDNLLDIPIIEAILNPCYRTFKRLIDNDINPPKELIKNEYMNKAAEKGDTDVLKWLRENGCPWNECACSYAAENGHLDMLKYLRSNGCPWNKWMCEYAARNGHLDVLKYLRENDCPWDELTFSATARNGHLDVLKYLRENDCPWDERACYYAAYNGHLDVLKWLHSNGCPWDEQTYTYTAQNGHLDVLKWISENGCPKP